MSINYSYGWQQDHLWIVILTWIASAFMAFGIGANDCATIATLVGAGVLKLWQGYVLATVFEILGAGLLGYNVTETIRKLIVDVKIYNVFALQLKNGTAVCTPNSCEFTNATWYQCPLQEPWETDSNWQQANDWTRADSNSAYHCIPYSSADFMVGEFCSIMAASVWLLGAAWLLNAPVSTTHTIVSATMGFSVVLKGGKGVQWSHLLWQPPMIFVSWVISPIICGVVATLLYMFVRFFVMNRKNPFNASLQVLPFFYFITVAINVYAIVYGGSKYFGFNRLNWWEVLFISFGLGSIAGLLAYVLIVPKVRTWISSRHKIQENEQSSSTPTYSMQIFAIKLDPGPQTTPAEGNEERAEEESLADRLMLLKDGAHEDVAASRVFSVLQVLSAAVMSFTHGANDTANAVGPLVAVWLTYRHDSALTDTGGDEIEWFQLYGAVVMILGLWIMGHKTIQRVGKEITTVTPASGFCVELATGFTVLFASKLGIPLSSLQCTVGAVTFIGLYRFRKVEVKIFSSIVFAWIVTVPAVFGLAAFFTFLFDKAV